jgi:hypothetical protein
VQIVESIFAKNANIYVGNAGKCFALSIENTIIRMDVKVALTADKIISILYS